jgi:hypothetical protein
MAEVVYSLGRQQFVFCRRVSRARCVMLLRDEDEDDELLPIADRAEAGRIFRDQAPGILRTKRRYCARTPEAVWGLMK